MKRDPNQVAAIEKAIREKYGSETIVNPKSLWDPYKEQEYLQQIREVHKRDKESEKVEIDGVLITKKLLNKVDNRNCLTCKVYSFNRDNDVYLTKYGVCHSCYVKYIEDREERWKSGWRPNMENKDGT